MRLGVGDIVTGVGGSTPRLKGEAAYAEFEEVVKGALEKGKLADLIVISQDITKLQPKEWLSTRVMKTLIDSKLVYEVSPANRGEDTHQ